MSDQPGEMPTKPADQASANQQSDKPAVQVTEGEPFDAARAMALIEKLRAENKELKPKARQADELQAAIRAKEEAEMTELQKAQKRIADMEAELKAERKAALVRTVAAKFELPPALADRLKGETPEELEADAQALQAVLKPKTEQPAQPGAKAPGIQPVNPGANGANGETDDQRRARIWGSAASLYDPKAAREHGGGVVFTDK